MNISDVNWENYYLELMKNGEGMMNWRDYQYEIPMISAEEIPVQIGIPIDED